MTNRVNGQWSVNGQWPMRRNTLTFVRPDGLAAALIDHSLLANQLTIDH
jgi:hypothetical protein